MNFPSFISSWPRVLSLDSLHKTALTMRRRKAIETFEQLGRFRRGSRTIHFFILSPLVIRPAQATGPKLVRGIRSDILQLGGKRNFKSFRGEERRTICTQGVHCDLAYAPHSGQHKYAFYYT